MCHCLQFNVIIAYSYLYERVIYVSVIMYVDGFLQEVNAKGFFIQ